MTAYILATLDITDPEKFARYRELVVPQIARFDGLTVVNTEDVTVREGQPLRRRVILVRFPDAAQANAFLDDEAYQPLLALRCEAATGEVVIVDSLI